MYVTSNENKKTKFQHNQNSTKSKKIKQKVFKQTQPTLKNTVTCFITRLRHSYYTLSPHTYTKLYIIYIMRLSYIAVPLYICIFIFIFPCAYIDPTIIP